MSRIRGFASDNNAGVHPDVWAAMLEANAGHVPGYGADAYTAAAEQLFRDHFGDDTAVFLVFNGTGANVCGLATMLQPFQAIICARTAHINVDECGAPERFIGCKLVDVPTLDGKLTVEMLPPLLHGLGDQHHVQPRVVSISQPTEYGTLYSREEVVRLAGFAHAHGLLLHMDGARIANAAAALDLPPRAFTRDAGVDVLSFGGTKNGLMCGEAVLVFDRERAAQLPFRRKQGMQLASKMRFIAAQFTALLSNDLWLRNARHANRMAQLLAEAVAAIPGVRITQPVQANAVFAILPRAAIPSLQAEFFFYVWDEDTCEVRWMTAFDTTEDDVHAFAALVRETLRQHLTA